MKCMGLCVKKAKDSQIKKCQACAMLPKSVDEENDEHVWFTPGPWPCEYFKKG